MKESLTLCLLPTYCALFRAKNFPPAIILFAVVSFDRIFLANEDRRLHFMKHILQPYCLYEVETCFRWLFAHKLRTSVDSPFSTASKSHEHNGTQKLCKLFCTSFNGYNLIVKHTNDLDLQKAHISFEIQKYAWIDNWPIHRCTHKHHNPSASSKFIYWNWRE